MNVAGKKIKGSARFLKHKKQIKHGSTRNKIAKPVANLKKAGSHKSRKNLPGTKTSSSMESSLLQQQETITEIVDKYYQLKKDFLVMFLIMTTGFALLVMLIFVLNGTSTNIITGRAPGEPQSFAARSFFPASPVQSGQLITVSLNIVPNHGETFYAIEEQVPLGVIVISYDDDPVNDYDSSYDSETNTIRWVYLDIENPGSPISPAQLEKTYVVQAPDSPGTYIFSGIIQFEDDSAPRVIQGETQLVIEDGCTDLCNDGDIQCFNGASYLVCDYYDSSCRTFGGNPRNCGTTDCAADVCEGQTYYDYPEFSSASFGSCQNTCVQGAVGECVACSSTEGSCQPYSEVCSQQRQCGKSTSMCGGNNNLYCHYDSEWKWGNPAVAGESCTDIYDNNCDGQCGYDNSVCNKGARECPVEILSISVSDENPVEYTYIDVFCEANVGSVNSIRVNIGELPCQTTAAWNGNIAAFSCNVGAYSDEKQVTCTIDTLISYQQGEDKSMLIALQASECAGVEQDDCGDGCEWCEECNGIAPKQSNRLGESMCVPLGNCQYSCDVSACGAECDLFSVCEDSTLCPNSCYDETTLLLIEDIPYVCNSECECEEDANAECSLEGELQTCGLLTCEEQFPEKHLTGSCENICSEDVCTPCELEYPGVCECAQGWQDLDNDPENGCEHFVCNLPWVCTPWSEGTCGTRTCTCACPNNDCTGSNQQYLECGGGSPVIYKGGGSPVVFKGGGSPVVFKGPPPPPPPPDCDDYETHCSDGIDNDCDGLVDCDDSDCWDDPVCEVAGSEPEPPVYTIAHILDSLFGIGADSDESEPAKVDRVAEIEYFFGFLNWLVIGLLAMLFMGLIFVQHIKPKLRRWYAPPKTAGSIEEYISKARAKGISDADIKRRLKSVGWIDEMIDKSLQPGVEHKIEQKLK